MNRVLKYLKKHKIGKRLLSLLLCLLTVVCFGGILEPLQAHAFALVDDAIYFIVAFLICCGLTFSTTSAATNAAQQFYAQAPPSVQEIIDYQAEQLQKDSALSFGVLAVLKSQWKALIDEFMAQFPQYCNIDFDYTNIMKQQLIDDMSFYQTLISDYNNRITFEIPWADDSYVTSQLSSYSTLTFCTSYNLSRAICDAYNSLTSFDSTSGYHYAVFSVPFLHLTSYMFIGYHDPSTSAKMSFYQDTSNPGYLSFNGRLLSKDYLKFFYKNELCEFTSTSAGYIISTSTYDNIVSDMLADDVISRNDNLINCDDLTIGMVNLVKLLCGEDVFGVGVDAAHLPGIDSFPSTADDLTDVSTYPDSIGISVPRDLSDTITKTAEDIRTVDKDKTDTKDDTKDDTSDNPNTKPKKPSIPSMSLPEILFKEKFPFCLPWDIYNLFVGLQAEAEAPRFVMPFKFERLGIDEEIVIDFSDYEEQIKIIRFFTGAMFVLALVMISRKIIGAQ